MEMWVWAMFFYYQSLIYFPVPASRNPCSFPLLPISEKFLRTTGFHCLILWQSHCSFISRNRCFTHKNEEQVWRVKLFPPDLMLFHFPFTSFSVRIIHFPAAQPLRLEWKTWSGHAPPMLPWEHLDSILLFSLALISRKQMWWDFVVVVVVVASVLRWQCRNLSEYAWSHRWCQGTVQFLYC